MDVVVERGSGIDVHKETVVACFMCTGPKGKPEKQTRTFGTTVAEILALLDWLVALKCTHVAMESTGVYWKPLFNLLEGTFEILVVNAQRIKNVPGRKTDVNDAEWIANLLRHGLLSPSFIPSQPQRELRELTRYRMTLVNGRSNEVNRIHKTLQGANIKLSSVATRILGVSGRAMIEALIAGETDASKLAQLAKGKLKKKLPALLKALDGRVRDHHRFLLKQLLAHIDFIDSQIQQCSREIEQRMTGLTEEVDRLSTIPGVDTEISQVVLAELGADMSRFATHKHAASWTGICPGNNESAGKSKSGKVRKGSRWLRVALIEAARAAARSKRTYLSALYNRLAARRGAKKAAVATAHAILVIAYHILKHKTTYQELGPNFFDQLDRDRTARRLVKRLQAIGFDVTLRPTEGDTPAA